MPNGHIDAVPILLIECCVSSGSPSFVLLPKLHYLRHDLQNRVDGDIEEFLTVFCPLWRELCGAAPERGAHR